MKYISLVYIFHKPETSGGVENWLSIALIIIMNIYTVTLIVLEFSNQTFFFRKAITCARMIQVFCAFSYPLRYANPPKTQLFSRVM